MASDSKRTKADPAAKKEAAAKNKSASSEDAAKAAGSEPAAAAPSAPANYSRCEGQKPVTTAYKENWKAIFTKKNAKKNAKKKKR